MEFILVLRVLLRRWWIVLIPVIVASIFAIPELFANEEVAAGGYQTNFSYSAAQEASNFDVRDGDYQDVWLASEFVVNAFTDWVQSTSFRDELIAEVGNEDLLAGLGIAANNDRSIGIVYMSHPDELTLTRLESAAIAVLQTRSQSYFPHLGDSPAEVTIINRPGISPAPPPLTDTFEPILQLGVAFFAGLIFAGIVEYFDPTLRYRDEVEAQGFKILGTVPKHK